VRNPFDEPLHPRPHPRAAPGPLPRARRPRRPRGGLRRDGSRPLPHGDRVGPRRDGRGGRAPGDVRRRPRAPGPVGRVAPGHAVARGHPPDARAGPPPRRASGPRRRAGGCGRSGARRGRGGRRRGRGAWEEAAEIRRAIEGPEEPYRSVASCAAWRYGSRPRRSPTSGATSGHDALAPSSRALARMRGAPGHGGVAGPACRGEGPRRARGRARGRAMGRGRPAAIAASAAPAP
jgi:hypothetical protein